ncbi:gamma-glutamyltranspeptidase / glutathione hydrolase [Tistlia consotensis]|uniref:Gamma-glutamyltranspeptidase / glutathione hydrolase n=1 Tax=Tistlia consotensis USBA 355 TaxID=560819 RepID=A0A1Y6CNW8_9PROT|nr:gamma-glutamyltransferase [Tistlia consotensis]SMF67249.1 gamma-glutamyltranspeptidase / glutathione hydrolase [Tistlia consotensis USBA 355]SNS00190.1 gamma-glutamyltranspeptidase / glutathione hydrolase [Tistlia consotensis]
MGLLGLALALPLAACDTTPEPGKVALVEGFAGLVAADEPNATVVGREILANNGTAIDAAVGMGFAMAVTLPSRVGLGGGGACLAFDGQKKKATAVTFAPVGNDFGGVAPGLARGLAVLHAQGGVLRWELVVSPAENLARFGHPISRAFANDLKAAERLLARRPDLAALFSRDGRLLREGEKLVQPGIAALLGGIRQRGGVYLHSGAVAERLASEAREQGITLGDDEIRGFVPGVGPALTLPVGDDVLYLPPLPSGGGVLSGQLWQMLTGVRDWDGAGSKQGVLFTEAEIRALLARNAWPKATDIKGVPGQEMISEKAAETLWSGTPTGNAVYLPVPSAGFVVGDRFGNAVACSFTLNDFFGSGKVARGDELIYAAPPPPGTANAPTLVTALVGNENTGKLRLAMSVAGGDLAPGTFFQVARPTLEGTYKLPDAVDLPRIGRLPNGKLVAEAGYSSAGLEALRATGEKPETLGVPSLVEAFYCPDGIREKRGTSGDCAIVSDPRGHGLAERVE